MIVYLVIVHVHIDYEYTKIDIQMYIRNAKH